MGRKKLFLVLSLLIVFVMTTAVNAEGIKKIRVQTPTTVGALPVLWMAEEGVLGEDIEIDVKISADHNRAISLIAKNEIDMMLTGVNVGAKVFNKGINIKLLNANIWAIDYVLTNGFEADTWEDLQGKTLSLPLLGGPLDFLVRYFLDKEGIASEEINLVYKPLQNGARTFMMGKLDAILLPEPLVTKILSNNDKASLSINIQDEWAKHHNGDGRIPFVGLFVSNNFLEENQQLTDSFNDYYKIGVNWVNNNPEEAAELAAKYYGMPAQLILKSFNRVKLDCYPVLEENKLIERYFRDIMTLYPEMIGGKLPDESFYF